MKIRPASAADRAEWLRLRCALYTDGTPEGLAGEIDGILGSDREAAFVAERSGGGLAGLLEVALREYAEGCTTSPVGYVEGWYVDPDARRRGIGRALVAAGEAWAVSRGCSEMGSDALLDNTVSHAAHGRLGYVEVERAVHFRKSL